MKEFQYGILKGRNEENCENFQRVSRVNELGYRPAQTVCPNCQYLQACRGSNYFHQFSNLKLINFMPYESVYELGSKKQNISGDIVIFDEDPLRVSLKSFQQTLDKIINRWRDGLRKKELSYFIDGIKHLLFHSRCLDHSNDELRALWTEELCGRNLIKIWIDEVCNKYDGIGKLDLKEVSRLIRTPFFREDSLEKKLPYQYADIADSLDRDIKKYHSSPDNFNSDIHLKDGELTYRKWQPIDINAQMIILDAYADHKLYENHLNRKVNTFPIDIVSNWKRKGIPLRTAKRQLRDWPDDRYNLFFNQLLKRFSYEKMVIYCPKEFIDRVRKSVKNSGKTGIDCAYFYHGRGTNTYKDYDTVVIFGTAEPSIDALLNNLRAFYINEDLVTKEPDKSNQRLYKDKRVQHYKMITQMGEIAQCAHRIRPILAENPKQLILVMPKEILDIEKNPFDELNPEGIDWEEENNWKGSGLRKNLGKRQNTLKRTVDIFIKTFGGFHQNFVKEFDKFEQNVIDDPNFDIGELRSNCNALLDGYKKDLGSNSKTFRNDLEKIYKDLGIEDFEIDNYKRGRNPKVYGKNKESVEKLFRQFDT